MDIVEYLRKVPFVGFSFLGQDGVEDASICKQAAEEIESLRAQLKATQDELEFRKAQIEVEQEEAAELTRQRDIAVEALEYTKGLGIDWVNAAAVKALAAIQQISEAKKGEV